MIRKRSFWGWGWQDFQLDPAFLNQYKLVLKQGLGIDEFQVTPIPKLSELTIHSPKFQLSKKLKDFTSDEVYDRASHTYGKSFRDIWRGCKGDFSAAPDYVSFPKDENDIYLLYNFAEANNVALIPYGGGSSVTGGVEAPKGSIYNGFISVDLQHFNKIISIDQLSRTARIQGGILGPELEKGLKPHGLTLRHFPQSFEFSTLGGWIATRSGGHYATLYTHIDEFIQSVRMITPSGVMDTRPLPGSGAGPSEERLISGSEGIFGIITEASVRLQQIPNVKKTQTITFSSWQQAVICCRLIAQSNLFPSNARLIDQMEAMTNGLGDGTGPVLILGFEAFNRSVDQQMAQALEICASCQGTWKEKPKSSNGDQRDQAADRWKKSFLSAPYLRDHFVRLGCIMETFETAVTWDKFEAFHEGIMTAAQKAIKDIAGGGMITCRFTHLYPDGPAPYYTIIAKGQTGTELTQWEAIKKIVSDQIILLGGTITHHHAVGRDHTPWYKEQRSPIFGKALGAVKSELDPNGILNPGILL